MPPLLLLAAAGCASAEGKAGPGGTEVTELRYQGSAGAVTFPELAADLGYLGDVKLKWIGDTTSGPQDIQSVATGQTEFGGTRACRTRPTASAVSPRAGRRITVPG
ncbi:hypothetical protein [Sphaerisporangium rufum]|uniref:hypothetical protein n=1 Tax=Sphaerisporangium rufum TaxID=1381558 RepID=UPI001EF32923|nr:hypothetical protein [Sphaerisporangium rufum]